jgi:hypothetical protein
MSPGLLPPFEQKLPEASPTTEVPLELRPQSDDLRQRREAPDIRITCLTQDLPEQRDALSRVGTPESGLELRHGHRSVPEEVGHGFRIIEVQ